ncbi:MAG: hypothetical protein Q9195_002549 [Heterodermia aff. obscurata]
MPDAMALDPIGDLLDELLRDYDPSYGLGSMTCSVYDTSWVACVSKTVSSQAQWLFPSSFAYVLDSQLPDGSWPAHKGEVDSTEIDGILSTMAALYCLTQHAKRPLQLRYLHQSGLTNRLEEGTRQLKIMLGEWDVEVCRAVGFEILVPSLLDLLAEEGIQLDFPGRKVLLATRNQKLAKIQPEALYTKGPTTLLHSLEALHGYRDFSVGELARHKVGGSMMASPSATASYLMRCRCWDDEAEAYLRLVISNGEGKGSGGVPSAYPSTFFELTWVVSTIMEAGLWREGIYDHHQPMILKILDGGGETPGIEPDLDDSSKASIVLSFCGYPGLTSRIVDYFDSEHCLKTYRSERNPSVSANCNALFALVLDQTSSSSRIKTIEKVVTFVCERWTSANGCLEDKGVSTHLGQGGPSRKMRILTARQSLSACYPLMLLSRVFVEVLQQWETGKLSGLSPTLIHGKIIPVLFQCLIRTLRSQHMNGSWGHKGPREETAYCVLALAGLRILPLAQFFRTEIASAISRGRSFIRSMDDLRPECLWIEKVSYKSATISKAYTVAALYTEIDRPLLGERVQSLCSAHYKDLAEFASQIDNTLLSKQPRWLVLGSWLESRLYTSQLQKSLFDHGGHAHSETAVERLAFCWTFAGYQKGLVLSWQFISNMMNVVILSTRISSTWANNGVSSVSPDQLYRHQDVPIQFDGRVSLPLTQGKKQAVNGTLSDRQSKLEPETVDVEHEGQNSVPERDLKSPYDRTRTATKQETAASLLHSLIGTEEPKDKAMTASESNAQVELENFLHCHGVQLDTPPQREHAISGDCYLNGSAMTRKAAGPVKVPSPPAVIWRLIVALAIYLRPRGQGSIGWTEAQSRILRDVHDCVPAIYTYEHELAGTCSYSATLEGRTSKDQVVELLAYERCRFDLAMSHLRSLRFNEEDLKMIEVVSEVADQTARSREHDWLD